MVVGDAGAKVGVVFLLRFPNRRCRGRADTRRSSALPSREKSDDIHFGPDAIIYNIQ